MGYQSNNLEKVSFAYYFIAEFEQIIHASIALYNFYDKKVIKRTVSCAIGASYLLLGGIDEADLSQDLRPMPMPWAKPK